MCSVIARRAEMPELRERFVLAEGVSQSMATFKAKRTQATAEELPDSTRQVPPTSHAHKFNPFGGGTSKARSSSSSSGSRNRKRFNSESGRRPQSPAAAIQNIVNRLYDPATHRCAHEGDSEHSSEHSASCPLSPRTQRVSAF